ncbi:MAG: hypothetical protein AAF921_03915 [Cyanobacteria bacterium P01_D01_bin.44]
MNTQLIDSLVQIIRSLSTAEQSALEEKLFFDTAYPTTLDLVTLALQGSSFDFLEEEPDLYSLEDGEPIREPAL